MTHQPAHAPIAYNALRTKWKSLVQMLGGIDATAACVRVGRSLVSAYGDIHSDRHVPIDVVLDAETMAGRPLITEALATAQGYMLLRTVPRDAGDLSQVLFEIGSDAARLLADAAMALSDHQLTDDEAALLGRDLDELFRATSEARQLISARRSHATRQV